MAPGQVYMFLRNVVNVRLDKNAFYAVILVGRLYVCANPFIYAAHFDPVRHVLKRLISCNKTTQPIQRIEVN